MISHIDPCGPGDVMMHFKKNLQVVKDFLIGAVEWHTLKMKKLEELKLEVKAKNPSIM